MRAAQATQKGCRPGVETVGWSAGRRYDNSVLRERRPECDRHRAVPRATRSANAQTPPRGVGLGGLAAAGKDDYVKPHDVTRLKADLVVRERFDRSSCHLSP